MTTIHGVVPIPTDHDHVYAFDITGDLDATGLSEMADILNAAFDKHDGKVSILPRFHDFETSDAAAGTTLSGMKAQLRSLTHVGRYAVVDAPQAAENMIQFFNHIIPVNARTFAADQEQAAWDFVNAQET